MVSTRSDWIHLDSFRLSDTPTLGEETFTRLIGLVCRAVVIWPQKGKTWNLKAPVLDQAAHVELPVKMP